MIKEEVGHLLSSRVARRAVPLAAELQVGSKGALAIVCAHMGGMFGCHLQAAGILAKVGPQKHTHTHTLTYVQVHHPVPSPQSFHNLRFGSQCVEVNYIITLGAKDGIEFDGKSVGLS